MTDDYTKVADIIALNDPALHTDLVLGKFDISHQDYRKHCKQHRLPMPGITPGLAIEMQVMHPDYDRAQYAKAYCLTIMEVNKCLYDNPMYETNTTDAIIAEEMRQAGKTEAEITERCGAHHACPNRRQTEVQRRIAEGVKQSDLAKEYGLTPGRISQLKESRRHKPTVTTEMKAAIRASDKPVGDLATIFGLSINTIYRIQREVQS